MQGFELKPDLIYLNHAAVAPWPIGTRDAVKRFADENALIGSQHYPAWLQVESRLRIALAELIHAPHADDIALLKSTSEALSVVAYGIDWQPGDNIVISDEEFPSNRIVWQSLKDQGVELIEVNLRSTHSPVDALVNATNQNTRLLSISSVQYASGLRMDLKRLGAHCKQADILFCIDAIQSVGAVNFNVLDVQADFVMADGHKWMLGPEGLALFYSHAASREQLRLKQFGWHMIENHTDFNEKNWQVAKSARRFECGSPNMLAIHALEASVTLLLETGIDQVEQKVINNSRYLFELIAASRNLECLTDTTAGNYAGIVVFRHRSVDSELLYHYLMKNNVMCAPRGGGIRFSPHYYTPEEHLKRAIQLADEYSET